MKIIAISLFMATMVGLLFVWAMAPHSSVAQTGDYDSDDDGLIEIRVLEQLNAVRWDLDGEGEVDSEANRDSYAAAFPGAASSMGCVESGCVGYELMRDLDFDDPGSYASGVVNAKWTEGAGWLPVGLLDNPFVATFEGNGRTIANLYIKRSGLTDPGMVGLFGRIGNRAVVRSVGMVDIDVTGVEHIGGLSGQNGGIISDSYATGSVSGNRYVGGLVGFIGRHSGSLIHGSGTIKGSHSTVTVYGNRHVGGLAGYMYNSTINDSYATGSVTGEDYQVGGLTGASSGPSIISHSYATGNVSGTSGVGGLIGENHSESLVLASYATGDVSGSIEVGGFVGWNYNKGQISASYATGSVSGNWQVGGLVGTNGGWIGASYATGSVSGDTQAGGLIGINQNSAIISASYWDTQTSGQSLGVGEGSSDGVMGKATAELQAPVGYTGIYAGWLLDFDNVDGDFDDTTGVDDFWDLGTASEYPALKADFDGDGTATWEEFGDQRGQSPAPGQTPLPVTPSPTPTIPAPTPVVGADLELAMLLSDYLGFLWYYVIVENNGPSDATGVVLTDRFPEGISPLLSMPVTGTCSGGKMVVCELGGLSVGSKTLVLILARPARSLSQGVPVNTASVSGAEADPYPANNVAAR